MGSPSSESAQMFEFDWMNSMKINDLPSADHVAAARAVLPVYRDSTAPVPFAAIDDRLIEPSRKELKTTLWLSGVHVGL